MAFLNPDHFVVIAGADVVDRIRASRAALRGGDGNLCAAQERDARAGILGAEIVRSMYGYSVRYDSGLQGWAILAGCRRGDLDGSYDAAVAWARRWQAADPDRRYVHAMRGEG